jgi:hypothetical protein
MNRPQVPDGYDENNVAIWRGAVTGVAFESDITLLEARNNNIAAGTYMQNGGGTNLYAPNEEYPGIALAGDGVYYVSIVLGGTAVRDAHAQLEMWQTRVVPGAAGGPPTTGEVVTILTDTLTGTDTRSLVFIGYIPQGSIVVPRIQVSSHDARVVPGRRQYLVRKPFKRREAQTEQPQPDTRVLYFEVSVNRT